MSPIDSATFESTFKRAAAMGTGRLDPDAVAEIRALLIEHLGLLLHEGRALAETMPGGSFDRYRMDIHLQRLTALHVRPTAPSVGSAYSDVRQLVGGCQWLLTQLDSRGPA